MQTHRIGVLVLAGAVIAVGLLLIGASGAGAQPRNSEQVVFSGVGGGSFGGGSPVGFWIWCEADSLNPYVGECAGSMYFYALGITKGVEGEVTEPSEGVYVMDVQSRRDGSVDCTLTNSLPTTRGPTNTVTISCSSPAGSGVSTNAVVNVTGP
jgi:hypothetical protein